MDAKVELRCEPAELHGILLRDDGRIEVACKNRRCGKQPGVIVLHYFDLESGRLVETKKFAAAEGAFHRKREVK